MDALRSRRGLPSLAWMVLAGCATGTQDPRSSSPAAASPPSDAGVAASSPDAGRPSIDASVAPRPLGASCTADVQCSGGVPGIERVCSTVSGTCISACHRDSDCATGETCDTNVWRCGSGAKSDSGAPAGAGSPTTIATGYSPAASVAYAEAHWDDEMGECAQFVSDSAIAAGGLPLGYTTWVPTLYAELDAASIPYDEYTPTQSTVSGCPGDIVIYSNGAGSDFCLPNDTTVPEQNCGHTGLVVGGGKDVASIEADFHNNAHQHMPLDGILTGTAVGPAAADYATLRVYHLSHCAFD